MSYYNQPCLDDLARPRRYKIDDQIENWRPNFKNGTSRYKIDDQIENDTLVSKMVQAIFLPGAWGKIPVFMGKNHPTPLAAMAFLHAQNNPPKT